MIIIVIITRRIIISSSIAADNHHHHTTDTHHHHHHHYHTAENASSSRDDAPRRLPPRWRDVGVLCRTQRQVKEAAAVFENLGVPVRVVGTDYYSMREFTDMVALTRMLLCPEDDAVCREALGALRLSGVRREDVARLEACGARGASRRRQEK